MHSRGTVETMASYAHADYDDVITAVQSELSELVGRAENAGVSSRAIVIDPGLGFSKRTEHSLTLLSRLDELAGMGYPVLVGPSRKRFLADAAGGLPIEQRLEGTIAACCIALQKGARLFRVHEPAPVRRALALAEAVRNAGPSSAGRPQEGVS